MNLSSQTNKTTTSSKAQLLLSIHVCSNRPEQIIKLFDAYQNNAHNPKCFEVIVNIDIDDHNMANILEKQKKIRPFTLKYINKFTGGFYNSHNGYNDIVKEMDNNAYFALLLSDEMLVTTKEWDKKLSRYVGFFDDDIFRIKCSRFKLRNYQDPWECAFAPDNITFTTRKWLKINQDWGTCFSSDAFQQSVSYYLFSSNPYSQTQYYRDIPDFNIKFTGDIACLGQDPETKYSRISGGIKAWFALNSYDTQKEIKRRALMLKANIIKESKTGNFKIIDDKSKSLIKLIDDETNVTFLASYNLNQLKISFKNFYRRINYLNYTGGGISREERRTFLFNLTYLISHKYRRYRNLNDHYNHYIGMSNTYGHLKAIFKILCSK